MSEARDRVIIDDLLRKSGWILTNNEGKKRNVDYEVSNTSGRSDYTLYDTKNFPICIIEAKSSENNPLVGKEQSRGYAKSSNCRFAILSNGITHYLWDIQIGNPVIILSFPSQKELEIKRDKFKPITKPIFDEEINNDYVVLSQKFDYKNDPDYQKDETKNEFIEKNNLRFLRYYQINAINSVRDAIKNGSSRFLLEMATGTGKTLTAGAIIKMFLRSENAHRVLFLVDRLELEIQAQKDLSDYLKADFPITIWKENRTNWKNSQIVISTIQSLLSKNKFKKIFNRDDFDLVISDEAHRSIGGVSRKIFEYFVGYKLGLTATPKNYLKAIDKSALGMKDPRELERRTLLDTYNTFGCEDDNPTFRYTLIEGVRDKVLVNPRVIDARSEISTQLLSDEGYLFNYKDEEGNDVEENFSHKDFEKKFFSENTNKSFCKAFLENAQKDPYTQEIGKTLIFCVSQNHASKIQQVLNEMAHQIYPGKYSSDFAIQVTSRIQNAQKMTLDFKFNKLLGQSTFNEFYKTSKARVCVTVGMMTTGYDARDILNICLMRPIFSPTEFVQMKGRGTRTFNFSSLWISKDKINKNIDDVKKTFFLFDFFGNVEYFEEDFNYDEVIKLPRPSDPVEPPPPPPPPEGIAENFGLDPLQSIKQTDIGLEGLKIDRIYFNNFSEDIKKDKKVEEFVKEKDFDEAEKYLVENVFDRPEKYYSLDNLRKSLNIDRRFSIKELLTYIFGYTNKINNKEECLEEEFEKFDDRYSPKEEVFDDVKKFFTSYLTDEEFRKIIDSKEYAKLSTHPLNDVFPRVPKDLLNQIPTYIKDHVSLNKFL